MAKQWMVRQIGSGEDVKIRVEADSRDEAIEKAQAAFQLPWRVSRVTARPAKEGERDDRIELNWRP